MVLLLQVNIASTGGSNSSQQSCNKASRSCQLKNITACLTYSQTGTHEEMSLFVQNNGENPLYVKVMILPANNTIKEIDLQSNQTLKVNISPDVDLSSTIVLNSSDGDCVIHAAAAAAAPAPAPALENHYQKYSSYGKYITPTNGAYLVIILLIVIGGILTFVKLRTGGRHLDGVRYHELEMGNSTAVSSLNVDEDEKENRYQDWDHERGEEKPAKSVGDDLVIVKKTKGLTAKLPNFNRGRKEWDD